MFTSVSISPNGFWVSSVDMKRHVQVLDILTADVVYQNEFGGEIKKICFSSHSNELLMVLRNETLFVINVNDGNVSMSVESVEEAEWCNFDNKILVVCSKILVLYQDFQEILRIGTKFRAIHSLSISSDDVMAVVLSIGGAAYTFALMTSTMRINVIKDQFREYKWTTFTVVPSGCYFVMTYTQARTRFFVAFGNSN